MMSEREIENAQERSTFVNGIKINYDKVNHPLHSAARKETGTGKGEDPRVIEGEGIDQGTETGTGGGVEKGETGKVRLFVQILRLTVKKIRNACHASPSISIITCFIWYVTHAEKKVEDEEPPAKLLDDLFCKTKVTPCIYWLPLTEEQVRNFISSTNNYPRLPSA